jgi:pimeloyl-ACP methyl ester carboxylesterase
MAVRGRRIGRVGWLPALALVVAVGPMLCVGTPARAVEPGLKHSMTPASLGLTAEDISFPAADSAAVTGWWLPGAAQAPVVVIAARGSGTMADMLPAAQEFLARGFAVLTFEYRGFGPAGSAATVDSLRYILLNSQWVSDMVGALRYARTRGGGHVFAWGQDLGSAVALAAAARERAGCDAVAVEGVFRTTQEALLANGTSVLHDLEVRHRRLVDGRDEPLSAASQLRCPLFVVLAGKDEVTPVAETRTVLGRVRGRADAWDLPGAAHAGAEATPGYFDRLAKWFKQWTVYPPGGSVHRGR